MSLAVYLTLPASEEKQKIGSGVFVRENGLAREISLSEWQEKFPGTTPLDFDSEQATEIYSANITHNLGKMAEEAGIYQYLWYPEKLDITRAQKLIEPLKKGLELLKSDKKRFEAFNPSNGWGNYGHLVLFVEKYLRACESYPHANVLVIR
jgi:hypothetical protein